MEKVAIANENSRKWHIVREMSIMRVMLPDSKIGYQKLTLRNYTSKEEPKKGTKHKKLRSMVLKEYLLK